MRERHVFEYKGSIATTVNHHHNGTNETLILHYSAGFHDHCLWNQPTDKFAVGTWPNRNYGPTTKHFFADRKLASYNPTQSAVW
jgi:hypothetical protein